MSDHVFSALPVQRSIPVPRIAFKSLRDFQRDVVDRRVPCIITGFVTQWPAFSKWSFEYLRDRCSDVICRVGLDLPTEGISYEHPDQPFIHKMRFSEFLDHMLTTERPCYYRRQKGSRTPRLDDDLDFEPISPGETTGYYLWVGSAGTRTGLHFDMQDNVLCQLLGEKAFLLVDPKHSRGVYPYPDSITKSRIVPDAPDLERFPRFASLEVQHAILGPGEMIFIPNHWWHSVISLSRSISVSHEFGRRMGWMALAGAVNSGGPGHWGRVSYDFLRFGLLHGKYARRLADDPPFGKLLYDMINYSVRIRLHRLAGRTSQ